MVNDNLCVRGAGGRGYLLVRVPCQAVGEAVGIGAGFDDGAVERQPVNDRGAEARVGECHDVRMFYVLFGGLEAGCWRDFSLSVPVTRRAWAARSAAMRVKASASSGSEDVRTTADWKLRSASPSR